MKKSWLSGVLSFVFPGLGHLYLGLFISAILFAALYVIALLVLPPGINVLGILVIWLIAIIDSIRKTKTIKHSTN